MFFKERFIVQNGKLLKFIFAGKCILVNINYTIEKNKHQPPSNIKFKKFLILKE